MNTTNERKPRGLRRDELIDFYTTKHPEDEFWLTQQHADEVLLEEGYRPPFSLVAHLGGKCPSCGGTDLQKQVVAGEDGTRWMCMNTASCPAQLATRLLHFGSRKCLDLEGLGKEVANAIAERGLESLLDLFGWTEDAFAGLTWKTGRGDTRFGYSRAEKLVAALGRAKQLPLHRWLFALGIPSIGENTSKEVSRLAATPAELRGIGMLEDLTPACRAILYRQADVVSDKAKLIMAPFAVSSRLGPDSTRRLVGWLITKEGLETMAILSAWGIASDNYDPTPTASAAKPLFGKVFALTGTLSVGREAIQALIEASGGKASSSVSKKTHYLVVGEGGGGKADKARAAGVEVLTEAELRAML